MLRTWGTQNPAHLFGGLPLFLLFLLVCFCSSARQPSPSPSALVGAPAAYPLGLPLGGSVLDQSPVAKEGPATWFRTVSLHRGCGQGDPTVNQTHPQATFRRSLGTPLQADWPHLTPEHCLSWVCFCEETRKPSQSLRARRNI